jgi:NAD(P)-dependent dehydrogenase (short-subunit alcohol dehydrogenase family)
MDVEKNSTKIIANEQLIGIAHVISKDRTLFLDGLASISFKEKGQTPYGKQDEFLWVNRTGSRLASLEREDFIALRILPLLDMENDLLYTNSQIASALNYSQVNPKGINPPLEAILHIVIPTTTVLFTQPVVIQAIASTLSGNKQLKDLYGDRVEVVAYQSSIYKTALACQEAIRSCYVTSIILNNRGVLTFGSTPNEAAEALEELTAKAGKVEYDDHHMSGIRENMDMVQVADRRQSLSKISGLPLLVRDATKSCGFLVEAAGGEDKIRKYWPAYPALMHSFHKRPIGSIEEYRKNCGDERGTLFEERKDMGYSSPLIVTQDGEVYLSARSSEELIQLQAQFQHHLLVVARALELESYEFLAEEAYFDLENLPARLESQETNQYEFQGEVAIVTGGASGIGKACVESLLRRGAAVASLDINPAVTNLIDQHDYLGLQLDLTREEEVRDAFRKIVSWFGGLDMLVVNAGIFPSGCLIESLSMEEWHRVMGINLDANLTLLKEAYPLLKRSPKYGRVVINGSRNVLAPGIGAVAYSSSKAALTQMARIAALEWGKEGIRVNVIHPDAVFDTGLWTEDVLKTRAEHYGMTIQQYKTRNLLGVEVTSFDVGEMIVEMMGKLFKKTTGIQVFMGGGNERVI